MEVRRANAQDREEVVHMACAMHAESPRYSGREFDGVKVAALFEHLLAQPSAALFIAEMEGIVAGMIAGLAIEDTFGHDKYVADLVMYVKPALRGTSAAPRLIKAFEGWAFKEQGVSLIALGISAQIDSERVVKLYEKLGYTMSAYSLIKENKDVQP